MIKRFFTKFFAKQSNKVNDLLVQTHDNGKKHIPFIVFAKGAKYKKGYVYPSHYCNDSRLDMLVDYCTANGISMENHGKMSKTNKDGVTKEWNYISLHINGKYLSGQCFHRILTTAMTEKGITLKPKNKLN